MYSEGEAAGCGSARHLARTNDSDFDMRGARPRRLLLLGLTPERLAFSLRLVLRDPFRQSMSQSKHTGSTDSEPDASAGWRTEYAYQGVDTSIEPDYHIKYRGRAR